MRAPLIATCLLCAWLVLAAVAMLPGQIKTAFVPASTPIPAHVAVIGKRGPLLIVHSEDPAYVRDLYRGGAAFVLPARKKTCLTLQDV